MLDPLEEELGVTDEVEADVASLEMGSLGFSTIFSM